MEKVGEIYSAKAYGKQMTVEIITIQDGKPFEVCSIPQRNQYFAGQFELIKKQH